MTCSQVTKLCDLGPNDGVCSVQWTREGSYISVGTILGQVQVAQENRPYGRGFVDCLVFVHRFMKDDVSYLN